jgi:nucleotide-binding universal stress UspA family protein
MTQLLEALMSIEMYRDVLACVLSVEEDEPALAVAETLAGRDGNVTALLISPLPDIVYSATDVPGLWADVVDDVRKQAVVQRDKLDTRLKRMDSRVALRAIEGEAQMIARLAALNARHADIAVAVRPIDKLDNRENVIVSTLFGGGRPVLMLPPAFKQEFAPKRVMVAWNASKEAARAAADAAPFLANASEVRVLTVDAKPEFMGHGDAPGEDYTAHLARRGLKVELVNADGAGRDAGEVIAAEAKAFGADLLVMGAYGHSRMREFVFGGVTRLLLRNSDIPILLSH